MSRASQRAGWAATLGFAALLATLFFTTCERREVEIPRGYRGEAARNPYFAAQRMLERMGGTAASHADPGVLFALPSERGTVFLPTARAAVTPARSDELMAWVRRGGHLVVVTWQLWDDEARTPDPILDALGVHQFMRPEGEASDAGAQEEEAPRAVVAQAKVRGRDGPLEARFDPRFSFELAGDAARALDFEIGDRYGVHLVTLRAGKGYVTALTDDFFLRQPEIGELDHAELVYRLAHWGGRAGPVAFVYGDDYPGALELAWSRGWPALVALAALVAAWVWFASRRFGPLAPDPPLERRALMEHVTAAGRFQWRRGASRALLAATRAALLARVRERHPRLEGLAPAEQAERLAALAELPPERVELALAYRTDTDASRFAQDVALLERIRRAL